MDAIVLVGGQGTRLRPLTARRHKSLVPVLNRPAIEYLFEWLGGAGVERVVLAIGQDNGDLAGAYPPGTYGAVRVRHVIERERLESGGAIRNAVQVAGVEGRFVVVNGDIYTEMDLRGALRAHGEREADLTLSLTPVEDPSRFGVAVVGGDGLVEGFVEKPPRGTEPGNLVNAGVWIFEHGLVDEIPPGAVRVEETLFPSLVARRRRVLGHVFHERWADFGTPDSYLELNLALVGDGRAVGPDCSIGSASRVEAAVLGEGCKVEDGAVVSGSVLWERVRVGKGAELSSSVLADGVVVEEGAVVRGLVAGSGAVVSAGMFMEGGSLEPGERYHGANGS